MPSGCRGFKNSLELGEMEVNRATAVWRQTIFVQIFLAPRGSGPQPVSWEDERDGVPVCVLPEEFTGNVTLDLCLHVIVEVIPAQKRYLQFSVCLYTIKTPADFICPYRHRGNWLRTSELAHCQATYLKDVSTIPSWCLGYSCWQGNQLNV